MNTMTTYSGRKFDPMQMTPGDVCIEDIAHALSLLCRGGGQLTYFYSVGQHSLNCAAEAKARGWSERHQLACLLHDASEGYISDIIRPVKIYLTNYLEIESKIMGTILTHFGLDDLTEEENLRGKQIDDEILELELKTLLHGEEKQAVILSKAIFLGKKMVEDGERDAAKIKKAMTDLINTMPLATIDYVEIVDGMTMQSIDTLKGDILCAIAVNIGGEARLIDNFHYTV